MLNTKTKLYGIRPLVGLTWVQHDKNQRLGLANCQLKDLPIFKLACTEPQNTKGRFLDLLARNLPFSFHTHSSSFLNDLLIMAPQMKRTLLYSMVTLSAKSDLGNYEFKEPGKWSFNDGRRFNPKCKLDTE